MTSDLHRKLIRFDTAWDINEVYDALTERDQAKAEIASLRTALIRINNHDCLSCGEMKDIAYEALAYTPPKEPKERGTAMKPEAEGSK